MCGMGMGKNTMASMSVVSDMERARRLLEIAGQLEEFAMAFPESRDEVAGIIEGFSGKPGAEGGSRALKETSDRIAAVGMLEILCGK